MNLTVEEKRIVTEIAQSENIEPAAFLAVIEVESAGQVYAWSGTNNPVIRREGHILYKQLKGTQRDLAVREGFAHPNAGVVKNPSGQPRRYELLELSFRYFGKEVTICAHSWGVGQVMGMHWKALGFKSAVSMMEHAMSFRGQVDLMMRFIKMENLKDELQRQDWSAFARVYNGKNYAKNDYHNKMRRAYEKYAGKNSSTKAAGMLRAGSKGARVRELQGLLTRAGHVVKVDGDFGPATKKAVISFQHFNNLVPDGVVGPQTLMALEPYRSTVEEKVGDGGIMKAKGVKESILTAGAGIGTGVSTEQVVQIGDKIAGSGSAVMDYVATGLYVVAGIVTVIGVIKMVKSIIDDKSTYEGVS